MATKRSGKIERDSDLDAGELGFTVDNPGGGDGASGGGGGGDGGGSIASGGGPIDPASLAGIGGEPGNGTDARGQQFDPSIHTGKRNADGSWRRKKVRKAGKVSIGRELPISTIELFLAASHMAMANLTNTPELALKGSEAHDLAIPVQKVAALYDMTVDPRLEAYGMLIIACCSVYGPKIRDITARARANRRPKPAQGSPPQNGGPIVTGLAGEAATVPPGEIVFPKVH